MKALQTLLVAAVTLGLAACQTPKKEPPQVNTAVIGERANAIGVQVDEAGKHRESVDEALRRIRDEARQNGNQ